MSYETIEGHEGLDCCGLYSTAEVLRGRNPQAVKQDTAKQDKLCAGLFVFKLN